MKQKRAWDNLWLAVCLISSSAWASAPVIQSAREVPVIRDADVVVVGGGSAAVAAAIAAKTNGASVFLVAPRNYLGDDLAGTRELWPAPVDEYVIQPLAQRLLALKVPFTYVSSAAPDAAHPDSGNTRLTDGLKFSATSGSVQYNTNALITLTFPGTGTGTVARVDVYYYYRSGTGGFNTTIAGVESSMDSNIWSAVANTVTVEQITFATDPTYAARVTLTGGVRARYLRVACNRGSGMTRQLLDEITVQSSTVDPLPCANTSTTPLMLKRGLELALEEAGVPFLGGSPVCDVLKDDGGHPAGVVLANRSGRQAVTARAVIDATENAWPAQRAGGVKTAFTPGAYAFSRIIIADATNAPSAPGLSVSALPYLSYASAVTGVAAPAGMPTNVAGRVYRCTFATNLVSGSMQELLEVEQAARDLTWVKTCVDQADRVTWLPPDHLVGEASVTTNAWPGVAALDLRAFRPQGVPHFFVLGARADVSRQVAQALQSPARLMALADRVGAAAAADALARGALAGVSLPAEAGVTLGTEDVREFLAGLPPVNTNAAGTVDEGLRALPVLADCDVLVVGAGTGGAPAAIGAGRAGADTIVIEFLNGMGGIQTDGRIGSYYHGNDCGFTKNDVDPGWKATGAALSQAKAEWYRKACRAAGARVLFGTMAVGAVVETNALKGVVAVLPDGTRGVIRAKTVVDSTGNADIAAAAGEETEFISASEPAVQGAGLAPHIMGESYNNTDVGFVDTTDAADIFYFARRAHVSLSTNTTWDAGQNPASRERRRLKGVVTVTPIDILNGRTYPDTIVRPTSNFDSHGFTVHDLFFIADPGTSDITANLPFRALVPKSLDGLLVTGLGISAHRDAMPLLRMQRDVQNQGYAAGYASALAVQGGVAVRDVNMAALQAHLVSKGIIGAANTNTVDNFPLSSAAIQTAVNGLTNNYAALYTVLADTAAALPLLRAAYQAQTNGAARLIYAHVLGLLRDPTGAAALAAAVSAGAWDTGWEFTGSGQYGRSVSTMDSYIIALGRTLDTQGLPPVLAKAALLTGSSEFSHIRAVSAALENLDGGSSLAALATLLTQVRGYAPTNALVAPAVPGYSGAAGDVERTRCLKELAVARALFRLGDNAAGNGAEVLANYARDPREIYASHARLVLALGSLSTTADGTWTGSSLSADWDNASNWQGGVRAGGVGSVAVFTNDVAGGQTISLQGVYKSVGSLSFGGADRVLSDGTLDIGGSVPMVAVAGGTRVTLAADVMSGTALAKSGAGDLVMTGAATLGGLDVTGGNVAFRDPGIQFFQAYAADPAQHNTGVAGSAVSLRADFRVNSAVTITHLGAYDSAGDGFENFKKVGIFARASGAPLAVLAFTQGESYELENGYRFRRLPEPLHLAPGEYAVVTFGFYGNDRYIEANKGSAGARVGALSDGGGALTFLTNAYYTAAGATAYPTTALAPQTDYAASAGSFRFATGASAKSVAGAVTLPAGSTLETSALDVKLSGGLLPGAGGLGTVTNASAAYPISLTLGVPAGQTNVIAANRIGDRPDGPMTVVKSGNGTLKLTGALGFGGGLSVGGGTVEIDSPGALGAGDLSFGTGGQLAPLEGGTIGKKLYVSNQSAANDRSTRLTVPPGATIILTSGIEIPRAYEYGGFSIQPYDRGVGMTRAVLDGAVLGYVDLYLLGDGPQGTGVAEHYWARVHGGLRKLAAGHDTRAGSRITYGEGCDFVANWFDVAGTNAVVSVTNNAAVRCTGEVRFVDGNASQLSLDGGVLSAAVIGVADGNNHHLSLRPVLFNGTVIQALQSSDVFMNLSAASAAPLIRNGGAIFDTQAYSVALRGKGFAQEPGSVGALVKLGTGMLKIAVPMTYTGPTLVSNGTLRLDFALCNPSNAVDNLLPSAAAIRLASGASLQVVGATNASGSLIHRQTVGQILNAGASAAQLDVTQAELTVNDLRGDFFKTGSGTLALACDADGNAKLSGFLAVQEGAFAVRGVRSGVEVAVPYPSFESTPLLPLPALPPTTDMDARGTAATNCPGWTFSASLGTSQAGYQRNNSYFSNTAAAQTTNGIQTAFVRSNGWMQATLAFPTNGTYTLTYRYCSRFYGSWFTNHILRTRVDGALKDELIANTAGFTSRAVSLGATAAGAHTLRFEGAGALAGEADPCTLIDDVRITGVSDVSGVAALSNEASTLALASGTHAELDYAGSFTVGALVINGVTYRGGTYGAATHPAVFSGTGLIHSKTGGTQMILR